MYRRMRTCLFGFFEQAERHKLNSEIVLVDWNPPKNKPLLKDAYRWPKQGNHCSIRIIVVPPLCHQRYEHWEKMPMNNAVAQNAAVRRARGKFVLGTSVDELLSNEMVSFLASERLDEDCIYLADLYQVKKWVTRRHSLDDQLAYCQNETIRVSHVDPHKPLPGIPGAMGLHTGSQADFTLMSRKRWHEIHGYPEIDLLCMASDSMMCYMAHLSGARLAVLGHPMRVYNIDHARRTESPEANWMKRTGLLYLLTENQSSKLRKLVRRFLPAKSELTHQNIPFAVPAETIPILHEMFKGQRSFVYNNESWGLGNENLEELIVTKADAHPLP